MQPTANQSELTGYNVKRHEFDPEYDPDAECIIAELEFREDDTPVRALSFPTMVVYCRHFEALSEEFAGLTCQRWNASTGLSVVFMMGMFIRYYQHALGCIREHMLIRTSMCTLGVQEGTEGKLTCMESRL